MGKVGTWSPAIEARPKALSSSLYFSEPNRRVGSQRKELGPVSDKQ
jgi:hypothetical protein